MQKESSRWIGYRVGDEIIKTIEPPKLQADKTSVAIVVVLLILTYFLVVVVLGIVVVVVVGVVIVLEYFHNFHCWFSFGFVLHCTNNSCLFLPIALTTSCTRILNVVLHTKNNNNIYI